MGHPQYQQDAEAEEGEEQVYAQTLELDRRKTGPDGGQIPGLLTPYVGFSVPCDHRHRAKGEKVAY